MPYGPLEPSSPGAKKLKLASLRPLIHICIAPPNTVVEYPGGQLNQSERKGYI